MGVQDLLIRPRCRTRGRRLECGGRRLAVGVCRRGGGSGGGGGGGMDEWCLSSGRLPVGPGIATLRRIVLRGFRLDAVGRALATWPGSIVALNVQQLMRAQVVGADKALVAV